MRFLIVWLVLAGLLIFGSTLMIWYTDGFGRAQEIFSPFNVANFIAVMITLSPEIAARMLVRRLDQRCRFTRGTGGSS